MELELTAPQVAPGLAFEQVEALQGDFPLADGARHGFWAVLLPDPVSEAAGVEGVMAVHFYYTLSYLHLIFQTKSTIVMLLQGLVALLNQLGLHHSFYPDLELEVVEGEAVVRLMLAQAPVQHQVHAERPQHDHEAEESSECYGQEEHVEENSGDSLHFFLVDVADGEVVGLPLVEEKEDVQVLGREIEAFGEVFLDVYAVL